MLFLNGNKIFQKVLRIQIIIIIVVCNNLKKYNIIAYTV